MGQPRFGKEIEETNRNTAIQQAVNSLRFSEIQYQKAIEDNRNLNNKIDELKKECDKHIHETSQYGLLALVFFVLTLIFAICLFYRIEHWWIFFIGMATNWFLTKIL